MNREVRSKQGVLDGNVYMEVGPGVDRTLGFCFFQRIQGGATPK